MRRDRPVLWLALLLGLLPDVAHAYIGPGAGLGMLGGLLAVIGAIVVALFGLILFPITLLREHRRARAASGTAATTDDGGGPGPRR